MQVRGVAEFGIYGVRRGLKFGTYAISVACEIEKCTVDELFVRIGVTANEGNRRVSPMTLLNFFYGAACHYAKSNKQNIDFETHDVSDWLDIIGADETKRILIEGITQYLPKNSKALPESRVEESATATQ